MMLAMLVKNMFSKTIDPATVPESKSEQPRTIIGLIEDFLESIFFKYNTY